MILRHTLQRGFALPTILIASVVMLMVILSAMTATVSINTAIDGQYYSKLADEASESGVLMARECLKVNGSITWSTASPLRPNTNCSGGAACTNTSSCYVLSVNNIRTTFSVGTPQTTSNGSYRISAAGEVNLVRKSANTVPYRTYTGDSQLIINYAMLPSMSVAKIEGGQNTVCGITAPGLLYCLGNNINYTLGTGDNILFATPTFKPVEGALVGKPVSQLSVNSVHGCAVALGKVYCWGGQQNGVLGTNGGGNMVSPVAVNTSGALAGKTMTTVMAAGTQGLLLGLAVYAHACALDDTGSAYCWGANGNGLTGGGQIGNGAVGGGDSSVPVAVVGGNKFKAIDGGSWHTCAISTVGKLFCWGADNNGQIGNAGSGSSTVTPTGTPSRVLGPDLLFLGIPYPDPDFDTEKFIQLASGKAHNCAVTETSNEMWCWGQNAQGQLGNGTTDGSHIAVKVPVPAGQTGWKKVAAGPYWTCGLTVAGRAYCWGGQNLSQAPYIGDGSTAASVRTSPSAVVITGVLAGKTLNEIWCTDGTTIVKDSNDKYYSWGNNANGMLGTGVNGGADAFSPISATHFNNFTVAGGNGGVSF